MILGMRSKAVMRTLTEETSLLSMLTYVFERETLSSEHHEVRKVILIVIKEVT